MIEYELLVKKYLYLIQENKYSYLICEDKYLPSKIFILSPYDIKFVNIYIFLNEMYEEDINKMDESQKYLQDTKLKK